MAAPLPQRPPVGRAARRRAWSFLHAHPRLLLLTHERPDGDAFGSLLGLGTLLAARGVPATAYLRSPPPPRYAFLPRGPWLRVADEPLPTRVAAVACLDCSTWARIEAPPGFSPETLQRLPLLNLDHHADNEGFGALAVIEPAAAATAQILAGMASEARAALPPATASAFLAALVMDTGAFQFPNTTPAVLRCAARLTAGGADFATVMDRLFYHEPLGRRRLAARLLEQLRFACSGRLAYACLLPAWLEELGVEPADTEGLIDSLRVLDGVDMVCLLQPEADGVRLSLRARRRAWPADRVAHALGGGGHPLAAGARLRGATLAEAEARLLQETGKTFKP